MPTSRVKFVNEKTLDTITNLNGGFTPANVLMEHPTYFIYHVEEEEVIRWEFLTEERFYATYQFIEDQHDNDNIVEPR